MDDGLGRAADRIHESVTASGAMPRFFIGVGSPAQRDSLARILSERGFDVIRESLAAPDLWPREFARHEGTHFNLKLFLLNGLEPLHERFGSDALKRLQVERQMFERPATWSFLWITSFPVAGRLRVVAPNLWKGADELAVFPPLKRIEGIAWGKAGSEETVRSGFGEILLPARISATPLRDLLGAPVDLEGKFWGDLVHLSPHDAFLTLSLAAEVGEVLSPELGRAAILLAAALGIENIQKVLRNRLGQEEFQASGRRLLGADETRNALTAEFEAMKSSHRWAQLGEAALGLADLEVSERGTETALATLDSVLEEPGGWIALKANLLLDRPLRFRAMLLRSAGMVSEAAADLDRWEEIARASGLDPLIASALDARALHLEDLGDVAGAERWRAKAAALKGS